MSTLFVLEKNLCLKTFQNSRQALKAILHSATDAIHIYLFY